MRRLTLVLPREETGQAAVEIVASDNGPGLAPEILNRLFQPFASTKTHGMGDRPRDLPNHR